MSEPQSGSATISFRAEVGPYNSLLGGSVDLVDDNGKMVGQIVFLCRNDTLRNPALQKRLSHIIAATINDASLGDSIAASEDTP